MTILLLVEITILNSTSWTSGIFLRWPSTIDSRVLMLSATKNNDRLLLPERCILALQSPEGEVLSSHFKGMQESESLDKLPISHNLLQKVQKEHLALLSTDAQEDNRLRDFKSVAAMIGNAAFFDPLIVTSPFKVFSPSIINFSMIFHFCVRARPAGRPYANCAITMRSVPA